MLLFRAAQASSSNKCKSPDEQTSLSSRLSSHSLVPTVRMGASFPRCLHRRGVLGSESSAGHLGPVSERLVRVRQPMRTRNRTRIDPGGDYVNERRKRTHMKRAILVYAARSATRDTRQHSTPQGLNRSLACVLTDVTPRRLHRGRHSAWQLLSAACR